MRMIKHRIHERCDFYVIPSEVEEISGYYPTGPRLMRKIRDFLHFGRNDSKRAPNWVK